MKALVIYDDTGRIWTIMYGEERVPQGLQCMWVDIPMVRDWTILM